MQGSNHAGPLGSRWEDTGFSLERWQGGKQRFWHGERIGNFCLLGNLLLFVSLIFILILVATNAPCDGFPDIGRVFGSLVCSAGGIGQRDMDNPRFVRAAFIIAVTGQHDPEHRARERRWTRH